MIAKSTNREAKRSHLFAAEDSCRFSGRQHERDRYGLRNRLFLGPSDTGIVADFLRNLNDSSFFKSVDLNKTKRGKQMAGVKLVSFTITVELAPQSAGA